MTFPLSRRSFLQASAAAVIVSTMPGLAAVPKAPTALLIRNVRLFDGIANGTRNASALIIGNKIAGISAGAIEPPAGAQIIDAGG